MIALVKQISIFVENKPGKIGKITEILENSDVRIQALMIVDAGEFGIIKIILDKPEKGKKQLLEKGFTISESKVILFRNRNTNLYYINRITKELKDSNINVQYSYGFSSNETFIVVKTDNDVEALNRLKNCRLLAC